MVMQNTDHVVYVYYFLKNYSLCGLMFEELVLIILHIIKNRVNRNS